MAVYPLAHVAAVVADAAVIPQNGPLQLAGESHRLQVTADLPNVVCGARDAETAEGIHALEKRLTLQIER